MKTRPRTLETVFDKLGMVTWIDPQEEEAFDWIEGSDGQKAWERFIDEMEVYAERIGLPAMFFHIGTKNRVKATPEQQNAIRHFGAALLIGYKIKPEVFFSDTDSTSGDSL